VFPFEKARPRPAARAPGKVTTVVQLTVTLGQLVLKMPAFAKLSMEVIVLSLARAYERETDGTIGIRDWHSDKSEAKPRALK